MFLRTAALILCLFVLASPGLAASTNKGQAVYERYCWWCHGRDGAGDGPAAPYLNPPPRDFTYGLYKWKSTPFDEITPSHGDFLRMLTGPPRGGDGRGGLRGTAMPGWGKVLSQEEKNAVISYIKAFSGLEEPEEGEIDTSVVEKVSGKTALSRGRELFADNCASCHGRHGRGDGRKKLKDDFGARTWPRNLTKPWTFRAGATAADIYTRITTGIQGTQMPSFADPASRKVLSDEDRAAIARYVTTLGAPYKKPGAGRVIKAVRLEGHLPDGPEDPLWKKAGYASFALFPQMVMKERHFTPTLDSVSVKALYNERDVAFLLEWDDRTKSVPGEREAEKLASGTLYRDEAAIQFPLSVVRGGRRPSIAMGTAAEPVLIWFWQGPDAEGPERTLVLRAGGPRAVRPIGGRPVSGGQGREAARGPGARGTYSDGTWRVVMKGPMSSSTARGVGAGGVMKDKGLVPVAIALWDGSNGERGSRHELTAWLWLDMREEGGSALTWPFVVFLVVAAGELFLMGVMRRKDG